MKYVAILAAVALLLARTTAADDAPKESRPDPAMAARGLGAMDDAAYRRLRATLAKQPVEDVLRVLDEVRRETRDSLSPRASGEDFGMAEATDEHGRNEATVLAKALSQANPWSVRVEPHIVRIGEAAAAKSLGGVALPKGGGAVALSDEAAAGLLAMAVSGARIEPLAGLDLFAGQVGIARTGASVTYLQDYDVEAGNSTTVTPIVGRIREGQSISCVVQPTDEPNEVSVDGRLRCALLRRPVEKFRTSLGGGAANTVTIQLPELRVLDVRGTTIVPLGGWLLVGSDKPIDDGRLVLGLLHVVAGP